MGTKRGQRAFLGQKSGVFQKQIGRRFDTPPHWSCFHAAFDLSRAFQPFSAVMILGAIAAVIKRMADTF